jgi:hypothetical protein
MTAEALISKLDGVQGRGPRWRAICPAHASKHKTRSLSLLEEADGRLLLHCHAGCDVGAIVGALGLDLADLFPPRGDDDKRPPRVRKPWRAADVIAALRGELLVAWVILGDVAAGKAIPEADRLRAAEAVQRIGHFMDELEHAR